MSNRAILDAIREIAGGNAATVSLHIGTVKQVDEDKYTCTCRLETGGGVDMPGVKLMLNPDDGMVAFPAIGSQVLIIMQTWGDPYVVMTTELDKVDCIANKEIYNHVDKATLQLLQEQILLQVDQTLMKMLPELIQAEVGNALLKMLPEEMLTQVGDASTKMLTTQILQKVKTASVEINENGILLNDGSYGGLVKVEPLVEKINRLEDKLNDLIGKFNDHKHPYLDSGAAAFTDAPEIQESELPSQTQRSDIENQDVVHGKI